MKSIINPSPDTWATLCERPVIDLASIKPAVEQVLEAVREKGDEALRHFTRRFDGVELDAIASSTKLQANIDPALDAGIKLAAENIRTFHQSQVKPVEIIETRPGVRCWRKSLPIKRVGLYIPGGSAPLFSTLLMLAIPAQIAGCEQLVLCSPPQADGEIHPTVSHVASLLGIDTVYRVGGAQAVAAMAYGTETVPKVDKIFGPGNQYVTMAKQLVQTEGLAIDMPAGPSEVLVIADDTAVPEFVAADLLSQAEHGPDSQVVLATNSASMAQNIADALARQLETLPRASIARQALDNSISLVFEKLATAIDFSNQYAPEHLIIASEKADALAEKITSAGSVFLGNYSCESAGDYASGTNHTLPTNGFANSYSGVSVDSFVKKVTFQSISRQGLQEIGPAIEAMAAAEQLEAHKRAVSIRLEAIK
jgi:histidinol dehydrogenase